MLRINNFGRNHFCWTIALRGVRIPTEWFIHIANVQFFFLRFCCCRFSFSALFGDVQLPRLFIYLHILYIDSNSYKHFNGFTSKLAFLILAIRASCDHIKKISNKKFFNLYPQKEHFLPACCLGFYQWKKATTIFFKNDSSILWLISSKWYYRLIHTDFTLKDICMLPFERRAFGRNESHRKHKPFSNDILTTWLFFHEFSLYCFAPQRKFSSKNRNFFPFRTSAETVYCFSVWFLSEELYLKQFVTLMTLLNDSSRTLP